MNTANATESGEKPQPATALIEPNIKIKEIKLKIIMCPATMFANKRTISAKGFVNTPKSSTGNMMKIRTNKGTPGNQKICPQKCLLVLKIITTKETTPNTTVNAIFPVTLADPGINPNKLLIRMKKKTVNK